MKEINVNPMPVEDHLYLYVCHGSISFADIADGAGIDYAVFEMMMACEIEISVVDSTSIAVALKMGPDELEEWMKAVDKHNSEVK